MNMYLYLLPLAQAATPAQPSFSQSFAGMLPAFLLAFLIFHLMVIRPQQRKLKEQQELVNSLKKNDQVITSSGIVGRVSSIDGGFVILEVAQNVRLKFESQHVTRRVEQPSQAQAAA